MWHPTEDELALLAFDRSTLPNLREIETHLQECIECERALDAYRQLESGLHDRDSWTLADQMTAITAHQETIRRLAAQIAREDEEAQRLLGDRLQAPTALAWLDVGNRQSLQTGGVVRRLLAAAYQACTREPLEALTFAEQAIDIAERLPDDVYDGSLVYDLRGTAWKERANALRFLGRFDEALASLDRASEAYAHVPSSPLGPATVIFVRASILYERGRLPEALRLAETSERQFAHIGDRERQMRARHLQANIRFYLQEIGTAREMYREILAWAESRHDLTWIARESRTLAHCALECEDFAEAAQRFDTALRAFRELGETSEVTRTEAGIGRLLLATGRIDEATGYLAKVEERFRELGLLTDAALVALHAMDGWYVQGAMAEIAAKAAVLIDVFTAAGMLTSALQAFAYLKEAATSGRVTPAIIEHVRKFVSQVEREPQLLFAPPPGDTPPH